MRVLLIDLAMRYECDAIMLIRTATTTKFEGVHAQIRWGSKVSLLCLAVGLINQGVFIVLCERIVYCGTYNQAHPQWFLCVCV